MQSSNDTTNTQFENTLVEYNTAKINYDALPKPKVVVGQKWDHIQAAVVEAARVKMDLALAKVVLLRQDAIDFLTVKRDGTVTIFEYNPFRKYLANLDIMTYELVEVRDKKAKSYTKASNESILWYIKKMSGDINELFLFKLGPSISDGSFRTNVDKFCKTIANIIRFYPHTKIETNNDYLALFLEWVQDYEEDVVFLSTIIKNVLEELKKCFFENNLEEFEREGTVEENIRGYVPNLKIQDCSKKCHALFLSLRMGSEKKRALIDSILAKGQAKTEAIEAKLAKKPLVPTKSEQSPQPVSVQKPMSPALSKALAKREREEEQDGLDDEPDRKSVV